MKQWSESRLKNLLAIPLSYGLNVSSEDDREDWPRYIRITDFDDFDHLNEGTFKSLPISVAEPALLKDGDLLFARCGATAGKTFLYSALPKGACYAGYLIRARFKRNLVNPRFVSYFTKGVDYCNWKNRYCIQTTIQNISADKYNQLPISIPSLSEQQRIVDYLDEKLAKIDERIEVLEKQQDAYARLKKSVIHQTVTHGLNLNVPLKDSGIEWIGKIPEHWERNRIKDVVSLRNEKTSDTSPKYIALENIVSWDATFIESNAETEGINNIFKSGDILFGKLRPYLAKGFIPDYDGICSTEFFVMEAKHGVSSLFVRYYILSQRVIDYIKHKVAGVKMPRTNWNEFGSIPLFLPPLPEQQAIASYLDEKCAKIDAAIENIGKQIDASKRLKRALINEVITGQRAV